MENIFFNEKKHSNFSWKTLGNVKEGRGDLGEEMPVLVYRLMQYTMLDVIVKEYGDQTANELFRKAGHLAGSEFTKNNIDTKVDFNSFIANLQDILKKLKIGILRLESADEKNGEIILTVGQDLDCSGLPVTDEMVCTYDEGFIAGILDEYTGKKYMVREIDCWASGDRVCRFKSEVVG